MKTYYVWIWHKYLDIAYYIKVKAQNENEAAETAKKENPEFNIGEVRRKIKK